MVAHRQGERKRIEGLGDDAAGAERLELFEFVRLRAGGHENDGNFGGFRPLPQTGERCRPVHHGHHDIAKNEVGRPIGRDSERVVSRSAALDRECRVEFERQLHDFADVRLVVNMKNANPSHSCPFYLRRADLSGAESWLGTRLRKVAIS